jgi:NADPH-dependent ferric siderophore reductase
VRRPKPQLELEVIDRRSVSPHLVRVTLGGEGFDAFEDRPETDKYVKLHFTQPAGDVVRRTYTVRSVDHDRRVIDIDFVIHGDEGIAGPWAARVEPGATITIAGPGGGYAPNPDADWYLFAGDLAGLPAIAAALEALPADAVGTALIEADTVDDVIALTAPAGVEVRWLTGDEPSTDRLADVIRSLDWAGGHVDVFAHGERESMKVLRRHLFDERGLERAQVSLSGYWARGRTEDRFQAEKREPIGQIFPEG